jgi:hypothetical protein
MLKRTEFMKKLSQHLLSAALVMGVFGCQKSEIAVYDGESNIYFSRAVESTPSDSLNVTFAFRPTIKDSLVMIPVRITGPAAPEARTYKVGVESSSTAKSGVHFTLPSTFQLPAGKVSDSVAVKLLRTPDLLTDTVSIVLELQANEYFSTAMLDKVTNATSGQKLSYTRYRILVTDVLSKPQRWLDTYLGSFTRKKLLLMSDVLGIPVDIMNQTTTTISQVVYWGQFMQRYLNDKKAAGQTIYEEDGTPMIMGPSVQ